MKFFWKVFFTTMFISVACITVSGYLMINANFHSQLDSEVGTAKDYAEIVYYSLVNEFADAQTRSFASVIDDENEAESTVSQIVESISIDSSNQKVTFSILDEEANIIFSSLEVVLDKDMLSSLDIASAGWVLKKTEDEVYIQTMRPIICFDSTFYIETIRDVSHVFQDQQEQYGMLVRILAGMIVLADILTFIISKLLLRRIVALTEITKIISDGDYENYF